MCWMSYSAVSAVVAVLQAVSHYARAVGVSAVQQVGQRSTTISPERYGPGSEQIAPSINGYTLGRYSALRFAACATRQCSRGREPILAVSATPALSSI